MSTYRRSLTVLALTAMTVSGLAMTASAEEPAAPVVAADRPSPDQPEPVARGLIVKTTTSTPSDGLIDATDKALGDEAQVVDDDKLLTKVSTVGFDADVAVSVALDAAAEIEKRSDVVWAAPDTLRRAQAAPPIVPNDPQFPSQRDLWDSRYSAPAGGYGNKVPSLWRKTTGSPDVTVAVLDTGILADDPDLDGQLVPGYDMVSDDWMSRDTDPGRDADPSDEGDWTNTGDCYRNSPPSRSSWHGTFVAGQVAARTSFTPEETPRAVAGVAPGVKVMPVRVLGRCGGYDSDILAGITWASGGHVEGVPDLAESAQADVVNLSLGYLGTLAERRAACAIYGPAAGAGRARGTMFVAAAGNDFGNADLAVPAACSGFLSVGATSTKGFSSLYSNIGNSVDLVATGGDTLVEGPYDSILGLGNDGRTRPGNPKVVRYEGTSMAAPQVAASAALLIGLFKERDATGMYGQPFTPSDVEQTLLNYAVSPFRAYSKTYANKRVKLGGRYYYVNLNCRYICGRGILDLSRLQIPLTPPVVTGTIRTGDVLTASKGTWVRTPAYPRYSWKVDDMEVSSGSTVRISPEWAGKRLTVTVVPDTGTPLHSLGLTTEVAAQLPAGPWVEIPYRSLSVPYGSEDSVPITVNVLGNAPIATAIVELRRSDDSVVATGTVEPADDAPDGRKAAVAHIDVPGPWTHSEVVRAVYLGADGSTLPGSSGYQTIVVTKYPSTVTTSLISTIRYTSHAQLRVTVQNPFSPNPTGGLSVYDGRRKIASSSLSSADGGKKVIRLPTLSKGTHKIRVYYFGSDYAEGKYSAYETIVSK